MFRKKQQEGHDPNKQIGDKNPPKHSQFKSGNPGGPGRPRIPKLDGGENYPTTEEYNVIRGKLMIVLFKKAMDGHFQSVKYLLEVIEKETNEKDVLYAE